ncbi:MAG TPA: hypothetical protein VKQ71_08065 [Acidimicrobiales bacterium]|nr:hypothetical protein [Acidimicrobiales bacterium]
MGQPLELAHRIGDDLPNGGLGQHPLRAGSWVDPGHRPLRRTDEQAVTNRIAQPGRQGDLTRGLPGVGPGNLGTAVAAMLDPLPPDRHGAQDRLEGEGRGAAADDPRAWLAVTLGQD